MSHTPLVDAGDLVRDLGSFGASAAALNASLAVDARVTLLLAAMTLDEKVAQLGYDLYYCGDPAAACPSERELFGPARLA